MNPKSILLRKRSHAQKAIQILCDSTNGKHTDKPNRYRHKETGSCLWLWGSKEMSFFHSKMFYSWSHRWLHHVNIPTTTGLETYMSEAHNCELCPNKAAVSLNVIDLQEGSGPHSPQWDGTGGRLTARTRGAPGETQLHHRPGGPPRSPKRLCGPWGLQNCNSSNWLPGGCAC